MSVKSIELSSGALLQNQNGEDVNLEIPNEGNLNHMKNVYVDGTMPTIEFKIPINNECMESLQAISYEAGDLSGDFSVFLSITNINGIEIWNYNKNHYIYTDLLESYEVDTSMIQWKNSMSYTLNAIVKDFAGNFQTKSINFSYGKKDSTTNLNLRNDDIIVGQSITIEGSIHPINKILGEKVFINFTNPYGVLAMSKQVNASIDGTFQYETQCNEIDISGQWIIKARWNGNSCLSASESLPMLR